MKGLNFKFIFKKLAQAALHMLFWLGVLFFYTYFFGFGSSDINYIFSFSLFLMPITIGLTYMMIYRLIPNYFLKKKYFKFGLYTLYALIISSYLILISIFTGLIYLSNFNIDKMSPISRNIVFVMVGVYLIVTIVCAFKLLKLNGKASIENSELEKKILETQFRLKEQELNYLKMQIHPHFLFNTLNTLYGFALKKADETPEMILKLSSLLDYLLYQTDKPYVLLSEEIQHIADYIQLEKMRFGDSLDLVFEKNNIQEDYRIAPMLLLPFVENSFKHGKIIKDKKSIVMQIGFVGKVLNFKIENSSNNHRKSDIGIGLENIKKRLKILYKDDFTLKIIEENEKFKVALQLRKNLGNES
ncbi:hypothetical protein SAMN03097699_1273 [Flavobacteriaceae bacterium MAR_2010_188]|nr:hypothetical protein SAMN03097699_1273 [Flavobacteriaceae bacterium MAR_2010_188]